MRFLLLLLPLLSGLSLQAAAAPFVPTRDDSVVEALPHSLGAPQRRAMAQLKRDPQQLPLALNLARDAMDRARAFGDPRELGQAQAALAPWWNLTDPPPAVRLLRATVRQSQHDFAPALADLEALLQPGSRAPLAVQAQAELTRTAVLQVLGRLQEAQQSCERLRHYASLGDAVQVPAQVCHAELMSLQGHAREAAQRLRALAAKHPSPWLSLVRAELAERLGDESASELYQQALRAPRPDVYTLAAYADWLLDRQRHHEVISLLSERAEADALLLRLALARRLQRDPQAGATIATLASRFEAAAQRGDRSHGREQARFELDLRGNASAAWALAQANWQLQKEPADAVILVRAARAAGQAASAPGWEDVRLAALATRRHP